MQLKSRLPVAAILFGAVLLLWWLSLAGLWTLQGVARWSAGLLYVAYDTWLIVLVARELHRRTVARASPSAAGPDTGRCTLAVLIAARNEATVLPATLHALLRQDDAPEEIWLIDDGSDDETRTMLAREFGFPTILPGAAARSSAHPHLRVLAKSNSGKADSLNRGLSLVSSDLVVTLDADTVPTPDSIREMRQAFMREPSLVAAGGVLIPRCGTGWAARFFEWFQTFEYLRSFIARVAWMRAHALLLVSGAFACYRRDALITVGGIDTRSWVEDYELIHRLHRHAGDNALPWRIRVLPEAAAVTDAPGTLLAFMRQRRRWFGGFLQTLYRNRDMVGNATYASVGRLMLPLKVLDTLQPVFGITAFVLLLVFLFRRQPVLAPVLWVLGVKLLIDFVFLLWGLSFYNRWRRQASGPRVWILAGLAALTEPFFFQLMRHCGAMLGWFAILSARVDWVPQRDAQRHAPPLGYTRTAMILHWLIAAGLAINIGLAWSVDHLPDDAIRPVIDFHKSLGITVLGLALIRLLWRASHAPPPPPAGSPRWERATARVVHVALYGLMLALPLSGWLHDSAWKDAATHPMRLFGWVPWPRIPQIVALDPNLKESLHTQFGRAHSVFADILYALFLLHVAGALKHQLLDRQPALQRMLPRPGVTRNATATPPRNT